jgi:hypothetical protein
MLTALRPLGKAILLMLLIVAVVVLGSTQAHVVTIREERRFLDLLLL